MESPKAAAGSILAAAESASVTSSSARKNEDAEQGQGGNSGSSKTQVDPSAAAEFKAQAQRIEKTETLPEVVADSAKPSVSGRKAEEPSLVADSGVLACEKRNSNVPTSIHRLCSDESLTLCQFQSMQRICLSGCISGNAPVRLSNFTRMNPYLSVCR